MRITCPLCGERGVDEFSYYGDATVRRPAADAPEQDWIDYVFIRDNPAGEHAELWYHTAGCHAWLVVKRHMRSHAVLSASLARAAAASPRAGAV